MDRDERGAWRHGVHRWTGGQHERRRPGRGGGGRAGWWKMAAAVAVTLVATGGWLNSLRPHGQLQPFRLPGTVEQQVPTTQDSAVERLQPSDGARADRSRPRSLPAPDLPRSPVAPRPAGDTSAPAAAATPTPGQRAGEASAPVAATTSACPPPLPPPKPAKTKKPKTKVVVKLSIFTPTPTRSRSASSSSGSYPQVAG